MANGFPNQCATFTVIFSGAGIWRERGLVGAGRADVRDDGGPAALRGGQRGRPLRVDPARRRAVSGLAEQRRGQHPEGLHDQKPQ